MRRLIQWTVMGAVLAAAACSKRAEPKTAPPREVEVLVLAPSTVRDTGEYLGALISRQNVNVLPQIAGYVRKINVRPGQEVTTGQTLLEVDAREETAALDSARAQERSASSSFDLARQTLERTRSLYQEGLVSAQELERAQASAAAAEASTRSAASQVSQRRVQLQFHEVRAPFAGTVGDVLARVGDFVTASTLLTTVAQADVLEVSVAVPVDRAKVVQAETPVELLDSRGRVVLTTGVYFVAPQADPRTQLVDVKAAFRNTVGMRPSELVRARIVFGERQALQVPALAVVRQSGQPFVFAVEEKDGKTTVARRPVSLGSLGERAYVVESGLKEGERIAVSSLQALRDGAPIQARPSGQEVAAEKSQPTGVSRPPAQE